MVIWGRHHKIGGKLRLGSAAVKLLDELLLLEAEHLVFLVVVSAWAAEAPNESISFMLL